MNITDNDFQNNEITRAVEKMEEVLKNMPEETIKKLAETADIGMDEWIAFGDFPTRGYIAGVVSLEGSQALHAIHTDYRQCSLAQKMVFIQCMGELLKAGV